MQQREIFQCNEMRESLLKVDYGRWSTVQLIPDAYTYTAMMCKSYWIWLLITLLAEGTGDLIDVSLTYIQVKNNE